VYSANRSVDSTDAMKAALASAVVCGGQASGKVTAATPARASASAAVAGRMTTVIPPA